MNHIPVFLDEVLRYIAETPSLENQSGPTGLDCTFGRGGHSRALLAAHPNLKLTVLDRDPAAVQAAQDHFKTEIEGQKHSVLHCDFDSYAQDTGHTETFDFILMDLGVSSPQLDEAERGFSFLEDGPMDMRMNPSDELSAAVILNEWDEEDLYRIFRGYGEVQKPARVVRAILNDRKTRPWTRTKELADMVARVDGWHKKGRHPATQYFMALRMAVNDELGQIERSIPLLVRKLKSGGRLLVITFHSIEDRIVKHLLLGLDEFGAPVSKKVVKPGEAEVERNPRARSAKLRIFERSRHEID